MTSGVTDRVRVAVLRGGPSPGFEDSLRSGGAILAALQEASEKYVPLDILISREGEWHYNGVRHVPDDILWHPHVVWNALHGPYGEDGTLQKLLESHGVSYTGARRDAAYLSWHKHLAKNAFSSVDLRTPAHELLDKETLTDEVLIQIFRNYIHPVIVKPATGALWLGVRPAHTFAELKSAVRDALHYSPQVLVEEFVRGKVASCVVLEGARGEDLHALMPVEVGEESDACPGSFSTEENKNIEEVAKLAHSALGMRHFSVSDCVVTPRGNVYLLETNSSPEMHEESVVARALTATGWSPRHFVDHVVNLALVNAK